MSALARTTTYMTWKTRTSAFELPWNDSNFASNAALSRQGSQPKSRMDNTYDSYNSFFVAFVIHFEQSTFFLV